MPCAGLESLGRLAFPPRLRNLPHQGFHCRSRWFCFVDGPGMFVLLFPLKVAMEIPNHLLNLNTTRGQGWVGPEVRSSLEGLTSLHPGVGLSTNKLSLRNGPGQAQGCHLAWFGLSFLAQQLCSPRSLNSSSDSKERCLYS